MRFQSSTLQQLLFLMCSTSWLGSKLPLTSLPIELNCPFTFFSPTPSQPIFSHTNFYNNVNPLKCISSLTWFLANSRAWTPSIATRTFPVFKRVTHYCTVPGNNLKLSVVDQQLRQLILFYSLYFCFVYGRLLCCVLSLVLKCLWNKQGIRPSPYISMKDWSCLTNLISFYDQVTALWMRERLWI